MRFRNLQENLKNNNQLPKVEKYFFVMRNRLYEAKSVFEGGNVALLNCFSMVSRRRFVSSGNGSGAVEVTTSGGWGCGQTREIAWFAKNMSGSGRSGDEGVTRVLSFDDSYVDGIGFFCRFELVNIKPEKRGFRLT